MGGLGSERTGDSGCDYCGYGLPDFSIGYGMNTFALNAFDGVKRCEQSGCERLAEVECRPSKTGAMWWFCKVHFQEYMVEREYFDVTWIQDGKPTKSAQGMPLINSRRGIK